MSGNYGHYGRPALNAAIAIGTAIVLFFILPFGVIQFRGFSTPKNNWVRFDEAAELMARGPDSLALFSWSTTLMWTGLFIAALGATLLMVLGFQPLKVDAARWIGASGGLVLVIGSAMAFMPAMYHVGTGFSTFMGTLLFTEFRAQFWAITPVIVAIACLVAAYAGLDIMVRVSANRDGIRDSAAAHARTARWAMAFMAAVLIVPWAIGLLPDGVSDEVNFRIDGDDTAPLFFSAQDIQGVTVSEMDDHGRLRYARQGDWDWMQTTITLLVAAAWTSLAIGALGTFVGTLRSVGLGVGIERGVRILLYPAGLVWLGAALFYVVSWFMAKPDAGVKDTFLPGFWPILVPIVAYFVIKQQWAIVTAPAEEMATFTVVA